MQLACLPCKGNNFPGVVYLTTINPSSGSDDYSSLTRARLFREKSLVTLAVFPCAGVGMLTPRSHWSSHMIASLITYSR